MSGDSPGERSSLFGVVDFRPRLAVVLVCLTLIVAVVGVRFTLDSGARRVEAIGQEAMRIFRDAKIARLPGGAPSLDPSGIEEQVNGWIGVKIALPREQESFAYDGAARERIGKRPAAAVRIGVSGESYLLVVLPRDAARGTDSFSRLFSGSSFLSWEKEGLSFVFWEREGVQYLIVSDADLTRTFELVRRYFT